MAKSGTASPGAVRPGTASGAPAGSRTDIVAYSIDSDSADLSAIVTGAIGDYGPAVTVDPDGKPDQENPSQLEFELTRGTFRLSIANLDRELVQATAREPVYPRTCSTFVDFTAATLVVPGSGTGLYRRISGSFTMTVTVNEVHARPCPPVHLSFLRQLVELSGTGTVSLG